MRRCGRHGITCCFAFSGSSLTSLLVSHKPAGPAKKKVRWSDEQQEQQEPHGAKEAPLSSKRGRTARGDRKTSGGKAAGEGGNLSATAAIGATKENVALPAKAPAASIAGKGASASRKAAAGKKQSMPGSGGSGAAPSKTGGASAAASKSSGSSKAKAGKGRAKALLQRMQKSRNTSG